MSRNNLSSRLDRLEEIAKDRFSNSAVLTMLDNEISLCYRTGKKEVIQFPGVLDATQYVEQILQEREISLCSVFVSNVCDFFPDAEVIKPAIAAYLDSEILPVHCVIQKENLLSGLNLPEQLFLMKLRYFNTVGFVEKFKNHCMDRQDQKMFYALYFLYSYGATVPDCDLLPEFWKLIFWVCPGLGRLING